MGTRATPVIAYGFELGDEETLLDDIDGFEDLVTASDDMDDQDWPVQLVTHGHHEYRFFFLSIRGTKVGGGDWGDTLAVSAVPPDSDKIEAAKAWCKEHNIRWSPPEWRAMAAYR